MRDSQKQKVYNAESSWRNGTAENRCTIEMANYMYEDFARQFDVPIVKAEVNRKLKRYSGWYRHHPAGIEFSGPKPTLKTVLHEFAHHLTGNSKYAFYGRSHGGHYAQNMLAVVEYFLDFNAKKDLNAAYIDKRVLVGANAERDHVKKNTKKQRDDWNSHYEVDGKTKHGTVYYVEYTTPGEETRWHGGSDHYGRFEASRLNRARVYRYRKSAEKAAARGYHRWNNITKKQIKWNVELIEADGAYNAYTREWELR